MVSRIILNYFRAQYPYCNDERCLKSDKGCGGLQKTILSLKIGTTCPGQRVIPTPVCVTPHSMLFSMAEQLLKKSREVNYVEDEEGNAVTHFKGTY